MLQKLRHTLVLILFLLLPFHALLVTVGTKLILGPGHPPFPILAVWKEVLMVVIFVIGIMEIATQQILPLYFQYVNILKVGQGDVKVRWRADTPTILIFALLVLAFVVQILNSQFSILPTGTFGNSQFLFGFKYLFLPLILFLLFKNLSWDEGFLERKVFPALLVVGGIVAAYGILTFFPPQNFFTALGYSDAHSLYSPSAPLSAFQQIAGTGIRRIQGTFAGPNQLGLWLLLPWSMGVCVMLSAASSHTRPSSPYFGRARRGLSTPLRMTLGMMRRRSIGAFLFLILIALLLTFSRAAWIGAGVILLGSCWMMLQGRMRAFVCSFFVCSFFVAATLLAFAAPQLLLKGISTGQHFERMKEGISAIAEKPLGRGLGSAGPAANRLSDACLFFGEGADISWAKDRRDLCLFVGETQIQPLPSEHVCKCPLLPENWYLQVGVELGVLGLILFVLLVFFTLWKLSEIRNQRSFFLVFLGVSVAALFLHAWEDSAVAYTVWGLVGIALAKTVPASRLGRLQVFFSRYYRF